MATVNKQAVAAAFGRAASGYTQHDELQRRCADLLLRQLARRDFAQVLDAGCGPGSPMTRIHTRVVFGNVRDEI
ncbi:hypothetical protein ACLBQW_27515, partial [Klebsiella pneumoniae]